MTTDPEGLGSKIIEYLKGIGKPPEKSVWEASMVPEDRSRVQRNWESPFVQDTAFALAEEMTGTRPEAVAGQYLWPGAVAGVTPGRPDKILVNERHPNNQLGEAVRRTAAHEVGHLEDFAGDDTFLKKLWRDLSGGNQKEEKHGIAMGAAIEAASGHHSNPNATWPDVMQSADSAYQTNTGLYTGMDSERDVPRVREALMKVLGTQFYQNHPANRNR